MKAKKTEVEKMFTNYMLIQKIDADGKFSQFLSNQGQFAWGFRERKQMKK